MDITFQFRFDQYFGGDEETCIFSDNVAVFAIGKASVGHLDVSKCTLFGYDMGYQFSKYAKMVNTAIQFYEEQVMACKEAVDTWTIIATRIGVVRDIRRKIGELVYDAQFEANYSRPNMLAPTPANVPKAARRRRENYERKREKIKGNNNNNNNNNNKNQSKLGMFVFLLITILFCRESK